MKLYDQILRFCLIGTSLIFITRFCHKETCHFTIAAITSDRPYHPNYETVSLNELEKWEVDKALDQPYSYFNEGGQAFIFCSADGQYILKFLKQRLYRCSPFLPLFPLHYRDKKIWKRTDKLARDFFSYTAAFNELKAETGVLFVHLNKTDFLKKKLEIIDPLEIHHFLDLDQYDFILQKRVETVQERISRLMQADDLSQAENAIVQLLALTTLRSQKGFYDRDPEILTNCGFLQEKAIKIDVGRFVRYEHPPTKEEWQQEFLRIASPFADWIQTYYPELLSFYQQQVNKMVTE